MMNYRLGSNNNYTNDQQINNITSGGTTQASSAAGQESSSVVSPQANLLASSSVFPTLNFKFKTSLCQNFMKGLGCQRGSKCHFAHGEHELRTEQEPLPHTYIDNVNNQRQHYLSNAYCNYKTVMCNMWENQVPCKFGSNCTYAHGEDEMRSPYDPMDKNSV